MTRRTPTVGRLAVCAALAIGIALAGPPAARAEPDAQRLGADRGYPIASSPSEVFAPAMRVGSWSALDRVPGMPLRAVAKGPDVQPLPVAGPTPPIRYRFRGETLTLDDYLERQRVTGLLVLKDGLVVAERYRYGRGEDARFLSFSMAKSVTALLVGIAHERGLIASLDDPAGRYATELAGSPYGDTRIRSLLRMGSGLAFSEHYDGADDIARLARAASSGRPPVTELLRGIRERAALEGERFQYAGAETEVLGRVLAGATGRSVADLTREWLWQPMGAEHDASWALAHDGRERVSGWFSASLRDWGRLGDLLARDGWREGRAVVPAGFLLDATIAERQPEGFRPRRATPGPGYGYQFWLLPQRERSFAMLGIHGQSVHVQPASRIVMVHTAVFAGPSGATAPADAAAYAERQALWLGVLRSLGGTAD